MKVFIDSNIPMYVAGGEHPHREPARRFLARVQKGEIQGCTSAEVLQEILCRYSTLRRRDMARLDGISAREEVRAAVMTNHDVEWIASFDVRFDRVPGVRRLELR